MGHLRLPRLKRQATIMIVVEFLCCDLGCDIGIAKGNSIEQQGNRMLIGRKQTKFQGSVQTLWTHIIASLGHFRKIEIAKKDAKGRLAHKQFTSGGAVAAAEAAAASRVICVSGNQTVNIRTSS